MLRLFAAVTCLGAALAILMDAGLPERARYTGRRGEGGRAYAPEAGSIAPSFALATVAGKRFRLAEARGAPTLISFWATWCAPCRREMLELQRLYETEGGGLRVLAVNLGESAPTVRRWVEALGLSYDVLLDPGGIVRQLYQVRGLPTSFTLDADHRIRRAHFGPLDIDRLARELARLRWQA